MSSLALVNIEEAALTVISTTVPTERLVNALLKNVAASSRRIYETDTHQLVEWLEGQRGTTLVEATFEDVAE